MRSFRRFWLAALVCLASTVAQAGRQLPPVAASVADQPLFVELVVNGQQDGQLIELRTEAGSLLVKAADLRAAGVIVTGDAPIDVAHAPGFKAHYDANAAALKVDVSVDLLPRRRIAAEARVRQNTIANFGAMMNYDFYAQNAGRDRSASLWTEQRAFGPIGSFSNSGTLRIGSGATGTHGYLRYDTRYRYIDERRAVAVTVGDFVSRALTWSTSVRMAGVSLTRDFAVRPDLVTMPLPSFAGQTAVPAAVDLFVNGYHAQSGDVAPGRFVLDSMPVITGSGQATIVTTDAVGRQVSTVIPFYVAPELLRKGLTDAAFEAGFLRRDYGLRSLSYGRLAGNFGLRRGLTDHVTIEGHGEMTQGQQAAGAGLVWAPGLFGSFSGSIVGSRTGGTTGTQLTVGYAYTGRRLTIAAEHRQRSDGYRDLGTFDLAQYRGARRSDRIVATVPMGGHGYFGLAYIDGRTLDSPRSQLLSASYSRPFGRRASLFISGDRDMRTGSVSAQLRFQLSFGTRSASAGFSRAKGRGTLVQANFAQSVPTDGGLGFSASGASDMHGTAYGQATAEYRTRLVQFEAGVATADGGSNAYVGATGTLVMMAGRVFAANQVTDAFAVVSTGSPHVPISYENQPLGRTDGAGMLFVPAIASYHPGRFALDPLSLAANQAATKIEDRIALRQGTGAVIALPVKQVHAATVALVDAKGVAIAPGSRATIKREKPAVVGWDGIVFFEDMTGVEKIAVDQRGGGHCTASVELPANAEPLAQIGPVPCL